MEDLAKAAALAWPRLAQFRIDRLAEHVARHGFDRVAVLLPYPHDGRRSFVVLGRSFDAAKIGEAAGRFGLAVVSGADLGAILAEHRRAF